MRSNLLAAALLLSPIAATAAPTGPEFGFRAGYSVPFGDLVGDGTGGSTKLSDLFSGGIPLQVDLGYRFTPGFYGGIFGSYGFLFATNCDPSASCSGHNFRLGLNVQLHAAPDASIDPWLGLGVGYEWLSFSEDAGGGQSQEATVRGFELGNVQVGVDFAASPGFHFGPFASISIAKYTDGSTSGVLGAASGSLNDTKFHEWLQFGLRATFSP